MAFKDHFSGHSQQYIEFRPRYPAELFQYLATLPRSRELAWDCGTGSGQAAVDLGEYFTKVVASDPSFNQVSQAQPHSHVDYLVSTAEQCPLTSGSTDLITVAQALHWFDLERFYAQVRRVGCPGSILAVWAYGLATISPSIDRVVEHLYADILGAYWPPERMLVDQRYTTIDFPFAEISSPPFDMRTQWNLDQLLGYLGTWSSTRRYLQRHQQNPLDLVQATLRAAWGPAEKQYEVSWPLYLRVGKTG